MGNTTGKPRKRPQSAAQLQHKREYDQRYREANMEKIRARNEANKEMAAARQKAYREASRDWLLPKRASEAREYYQRLKNDPERWSRRLAGERKRRAARRKQIRAGVQRRQHGLTPEGWSAMLVAQDGCCYLCELPLEPARTHVEHDHRCCPKNVSCAACRRGLACNACNRLIGFADDDPDRLIRIAENLRKAQATVTERLRMKPVQEQMFADDAQAKG
jgi:hypothetical protein